MGMSSFVVAIKPPDEQWTKMRDAWFACKAANVPIPSEVERYFEGEEPDPSGVKIDLSKHEAVTEWEGDADAGYDVDLRKLPEGVYIVRFVNSW
jgi:hypothetical protein